jgi:hypothetical protein
VLSTILGTSRAVSIARMLQDVVTRFPVIVRTVVPQPSVLSADEIATILKIGFLATEIDFDEDPDEMDALEPIGRMLWELAGYQPPDHPVPIVSPLPLPEDYEARIKWVHQLARQLESTEARELAFTIAYLFTMLDLEVDNVESELLDELRHELQLGRERASELAATTAALETPGVDEVVQP